MSLNTYPYNPFPASTNKLDEAHNAELQQEIDTVKSGLTNYETQNNINLEVPNRKNVLPYPYGDTTKTESGLSFTDNGDGSITVSGTATQDTEFAIANSTTHTSFSIDADNYILTGCPEGGEQSKYYIGIFKNGQLIGRDYGNGLSVSGIYKTDIIGCAITIKSGTVISTPMTFYPMIRPATITDPTYAPYIPSVESRIEAVERKLTVAYYDTGDITTSVDGSFNILSTNLGQIIFVRSFGSHAIVPTSMTGNNNYFISYNASTMAPEASTNIGKVRVYYAV